MDKLKQKIVDLGRIVAIFMMLWPIIIIIKNKVWNQDTWFFFICSILYDIYMYNVITNNGDKT